MDYTKYMDVPQSKHQIGREDEMVMNRAGGSVFKLDPMRQLQRFLILGTEGPTYYASEPDMTIENARNAVACIKRDGIAVVEMVKETSSSFRAPKKEPQLFVLALCAKTGNQQTKTVANDAVTGVCQIPTHLFTYAKYCKALGGHSGQGIRRGIRRWYLDSDAPKIINDFSMGRF